LISNRGKRLHEVDHIPLAVSTGCHSAFVDPYLSPRESLLIPYAICT